MNNFENLNKQNSNCTTEGELNNLQLHLLSLNHDELVKLNKKLNLGEKVQEMYRYEMALIIVKLIAVTNMEDVYDDDIMNLIKNPETRQKFADKVEENKSDELLEVTEEFINLKEKEIKFISELSDFKMYKICTIANIDINERYDSILRKEIYNFLTE